jgi:hypothetical protein
MLRFVYNKPLSDPDLQAALDTLPPHRSALKAFAAFAVAFGLAWIQYR